MKNFYLLDYLKEDKGADKIKLDFLKYELDKRIYYYGQHFKQPKEKQSQGIFLDIKNGAKQLIKEKIKSIYNIFFVIINSNKLKGKIVISNAYFPVNEELVKNNINVVRPIHNSAKGRLRVGNFKIYKNFLKINQIINNGNFKFLISDVFLKQINLFIYQACDYYKSIRADALIVPNDISFFEQINIEIFKKIGKPSFVFLHGLPIYNVLDNNQADYLVVWGRKIKENYINIGFPENKILISGHPYYSNLNDNKLRNNIDDILVLSKAMSGAQLRDETRLSDRGNSILYLYSIEKILKSQGIKNVRLRVHPSESIDWYFKFIDSDFFVADREPLKDSLVKSTLVIGPTSTVFLESIYYGVNYLVYEPTVNGLDLSGYPLCPPFDGSDDKVFVAKTEEDLSELLSKNAIVDKTVFNDYIDTPFDVKVITERI